MAKARIKKGEDATVEDVVGFAGVGGERMPVPNVPDSDIGEDRRDQDLEEEVTSGGIQARMLAALESLAAKPDRTDREDSALDRLAAAFERMASAQLEGADRVAKATKAVTRPSNEAPPKISTLNPRGDKDFPRPQLKATFLLPWAADWDTLTREEIELLNLILPGDYVVKRNDATKVKIAVRATYKVDSDTIDKVLFVHETAFNNDYHSLMPPDWIRQMVRQNPKTRAACDAVLTMDEEEDLILAGCLNDGSKSGKLVSVGE